jgi:WbqC-like protein family
MKLAVMQPYFFPYIGYFQMINAVDVFVVYDDVNYIKQGWINRNNVLVNNQKYVLNLQLIGASSFKKINEININDNSKVLKTIQQSYCKAPFFNQVNLVLIDIFSFEEKNLGIFLMNLLIKVSKYLKIKTHFILSSSLEKNNELKGQEKILEICKKLGATNYINAIGGQELYDKTSFLNNKIELNFIQTNPIEYKQFQNEFVAWLSIIDVMMFNSIDEIKIMLNQYQLI